MKRLVFSAALCIFFSEIIAQTPKVEWAKSIGGAGNERANSVETDHKGNIILAGRFQSSSIKVDDITLSKNTEDNADVADVFILKLNNKGKPIWAITAGGKGDDHAMSCVTDQKGNIYVVGWFESKTLSFGDISLSRKTEKGSDMFVAKFSPEGNCIWAKNAGGKGGSGNYSSILLDSENNVVIGGIAGAEMNFDEGITLKSKKGGMYLAKYSNEGKIQWAKGTDGGECQGVGIGKNNQIFAGGFYTDSIRFEEINLTSRGAGDAFLVKFSPDGNTLWGKSIGGKGFEIASCEADHSGNVYLGGLFFSDTIQAEQTRLVNKGEGNVFMVKYDDSGKMLWAKSAGGSPKGTGGREFYVSGNGDAFITGSNFNDFLFAGKTIKNTAGSEDIFLMKFDKDGQEKWAVDYGGSGRNAGRGITQDKKGNIFLTGSFDEKQLKADKFSLSNMGDSDIFVLKFRESNQ